MDGGSAPLRALPADFDAAVVRGIDGRLAGCQAEHGVRILLAVESGSRAWGFPSPDSDYDCRFLYMRPLSDYVTPWPRRDVIETPLDDIYDVNGWDLITALKLMFNGNAVVAEWLTSPIVNRGDAAFRDRLLALARRIGRRDVAVHHYLQLGERQFDRFFADGHGPLKRLFYAVRPAMALRWLRLRPDGAVPPMHLPSLVAEAGPDAAVTAEIARLTAVKATTGELGEGPLPSVVADFLRTEFAAARAAVPRKPEADPVLAREAEGLLYETARGFESVA
jgi:predicted nucleotidyltransferase